MNRVFTIFFLITFFLSGGALIAGLIAPGIFRRLLGSRATLGPQGIPYRDCALQLQACEENCKADAARNLNRGR